MLDRPPTRAHGQNLERPTVQPNPSHVYFHVFSMFFPLGSWICLVWLFSKHIWKLFWILGARKVHLILLYWWFGIAKRCSGRGSAWFLELPHITHACRPYLYECFHYWFSSASLSSFLFSVLLRSSLFVLLCLGPFLFLYLFLLSHCHFLCFTFFSFCSLLLTTSIFSFLLTQIGSAGLSIRSIAEWMIVLHYKVVPSKRDCWVSIYAGALELRSCCRVAGWILVSAPSGSRLPFQSSLPL